MPTNGKIDDPLLKLLRAGLYNSSAPLGGSFPLLSAEEWCGIYEESKRQTVSGVMFQALSLLQEEKMPPVDLLSRWLVRSHRIEQAHHSMSEILTRLIPALKAENLHPVLQKGHAVARFYSCPELRMCGDIDLWFPGDERSLADKFISSKGIQVSPTPDNGSGYLMNGIEVEHHTSLIELHSPFHARKIARLVELQGSVDVSLPNGMMGKVPAPLIELMMFNVHILKHCLGVGIGLRHFCDYAMAWNGLVDNGKLSADNYFKVCEDLGILGWTSILHRFINKYLSSPDGDAVTPLPGDLNDKVLERIFNMVMEGGNFGLFNEKRAKTLHKNRWLRKLNTMSAFLGNASLAIHIAPSEAFWTFSRLLIGQLN